MNGDTCISIEPLNNKEVVFIIGNTPTVTFNNNVTVYTYPNVICETDIVNNMQSKPQSKPQIKMTFIKYLKNRLIGL